MYDVAKNTIMRNKAIVCIALNIPVEWFTEETNNVARKEKMLVSRTDFMRMAGFIENFLWKKTSVMALSAMTAMRK